jgi:hypothetical protein
MAQRVEGLEDALHALIDKGLPPPASVRVLDHGICGGLLLLKWSTLWHNFNFALRAATPAAGSEEARVKDETVAKMNQWPRFNASHWWKGVVWATASVALHNIQQNDRIPGWKKKLHLAEDPLSYLGVLVDLLQEWDRHSARKLRGIEGTVRRINSGDVMIGKSPTGVIHLDFGCRDDEYAKREAKMKKDLDVALADWDKLVSFKFTRV